MKKSIVLTLILAGVVCAGYTYDIETDFPTSSGFSFPGNGWTIGSDCVTTTWGVPTGEVAFDTFIDTGTSYILRGPSASYAPDARLDSYATNPVFSMRTRFQTDASGNVTNDFGTYLTWQAAEGGLYNINLTANSTSLNTLITFTINGEVINSINGVDTLNANLDVALTDYSLSEGDVIKVMLANDYDYVTGSAFNYQTQTYITSTISQVPEPATLSLLGMGCMLLRRKLKANAKA